MVSSEISITEQNPALEMVKSGGGSLSKEDCTELLEKSYGKVYAPEWWMDLRTSATISVGFLGIVGSSVVGAPLLASIATAAAVFTFFGLSRVPYRRRMREMSHLPKQLDPYATYEYLESSKWGISSTVIPRCKAKKHYFAYEKENQSGILEITVGHGMFENRILDVAKYSLKNSPEIELNQNESANKSKIENPLLANMAAWDQALAITKATP